jgi:hypothetical protein
MFQHLEIESREEVSATERTTGMTALGAVHHAKDISPDLRSNCF